VDDEPSPGMTVWYNRAKVAAVISPRILMIVFVRTGIHANLFGRPVFRLTSSNYQGRRAPLPVLDYRQVLASGYRSRDPASIPNNTRLPIGYHSSATW
jgi:hypothetical protein